MCNAMGVARDVLPANTKMYGGHEYTVTNLNFGLKVDPGNAAITAKLEQASKLREEDVWTVPTLLSEEKQINVFMRSLDSDI